MMHGGRILAETDLTFKPDYSWVPDGMQGFAGGVVGAAMLVVVVLVGVGAIRFIWTRMTGPTWDNVLGDRIIVGCLVGAALISQLGPGVGWGNDMFGDGVTVTAATSGDGRDWKGKDYTKTAVEKLRKGDPIGAAKDIAKGAYANTSKSASDAKKHWDQAMDSNQRKDTAGTVGNLAAAAGNALATAGNAAKDTGTAIKDAVSTGIKWAWGQVTKESS